MAAILPLSVVALQQPGVLQSSASIGAVTQSVELERNAFLAAHGSDAAKAERALRKKQEWLDENPVRMGGDVAPFLRSEGYTVPIEGCYDRDGNPVVYSRGVPHGSKDEVM